MQYVVIVRVTDSDSAGPEVAGIAGDLDEACSLAQEDWESSPSYLGDNHPGKESERALGWSLDPGRKGVHVASADEWLVYEVHEVR